LGISAIIAAYNEEKTIGEVLGVLTRMGSRLGALLELFEQVVDPLQHIPFRAGRKALDSLADRLPILSLQLAEDAIAEHRQVHLFHGQAQLEHLLPEKVSLHQQDQEHRPGLERDQVEVFQAGPRAVRRGHDRCVLGDRRHHHRHLLDESLAVGRCVLDLLGDVVPDLGRDRLRVHQEVDEVPVAHVARDAPR